MRELVGLGVDPAERLEALEILVLGEEVGQVDKLVCAALRDHHNAADLLHLHTRQ